MIRLFYISCLILSVWISTSNAMDAFFTGRGAALCSQFTEEIRENKQYEYIYFSWAQGYMSAMNGRNYMTSNKSINLEPISMEGPQQLEWLKAYCVLNPEKAVVFGVADLFQELGKQ